MIVLNGVLIARLKPQLTYNIEPSSIRMGFFNSSEINSIQMGTYIKTETFSQQIIGNLGDVVICSKRVFDHIEEDFSEIFSDYLIIRLKIPYFFRKRIKNIMKVYDMKRKLVI